ncbi:MAG TPA: tripartite tricarboxylate transporter substrate binding protein [Usitatibacter sp.]|nr:tripartite tricarboxylate transporter substrate binding protein [Usitatibacter sp.]
MKQTNARSRLIAAALICLAAMWAPGVSAQAQDYPSRTVKIIVPFPPGGPNDLLARLLGQELSKAWSQPVIIENKPGGGTIIGTELASKAPPDGYTLLMLSPSHSVNPSLKKSLPYDLLRDFIPVIHIAESPNVLVVAPGFDVGSVAELIERARSQPGRIAYGSGGVGTATHLGGEMLSVLGNVKMIHVPYKGDAPAMTDLLGGQISWMFGTILSTLPNVKAGKVKAIAISGKNRSPALPDVPPVADTLPGFDATSWYGVAVPAGTPREIVMKLNAELNRIATSGAVKDRLLNEGAVVVGGSPEQFTTYLRETTARWARVIRDAGIKVE